MKSQVKRSNSTRTSVTAEAILDAAIDIVENEGIDAMTMRRLSDRLGVAVTSIYWHVGSRDELLDRLVDRLVLYMSDLGADGSSPIKRIASIAGAQRQMLIERQQLLGVAHQRGRTPQLFLPVQQTLARLLGELGIVGADAALTIRAIQITVISSAVMEFSGIRSPRHPEEDASLWAADWPDRELIDALSTPTDYAAVFDYTLATLLANMANSAIETP